MKIKKSKDMFEVELSVVEVKSILQEGYLMDALNHAEKYLRVDETLDEYINEANFIIDYEDDVLLLWDKLRKSMPKGSKKAFLRSELKKLKNKMDEDFMKFSAILLETFPDESYLDDVSKYVDRYRY